MKVAVVVNKFPVISETFVINHVVSLLEAGVAVTVFSLAPPNKNQQTHPQFIAKRLQEHVIYGEPVPINKFKRVLRFLTLLNKWVFSWKRPAILKLLDFKKYGKEALDLSLFFNAQPFFNNNKFDIIHCHFGHVGNVVQKLKGAGLLEGKIVVSFHGFEFLKEAMLRHNNYYEGVFRNCDGIVANSEFTLQRLSMLGCPTSKLIILPVVLSNMVFTERHSRPEPVQPEFFRVLTIARLVEKKGIRYAIEGINILKNQYQIPVQYKIIGSGPLLPELQAMVRQLNLEKEVIFLGSQSQDSVAAELADTDVFLLPSIVDATGDTETQGLVLIEAQLMEVPVVSTKVGGIPDSVKPNESALLVDEKDPICIAKAILEFYTNPSMRAEFGEAGKKYVLQKFDTRIITNNTISFYEKLLDKQ